MEDHARYLADWGRGWVRLMIALQMGTIKSATLTVLFTLPAVSKWISLNFFLISQS